MSTIDSKEIIDKIIAQHGIYGNDPCVAQIVRYTSAWGNEVYGVTWVTESLSRQRRYEIETQMVKNPIVIWRQTDNSEGEQGRLPLGE